MMAASNIPNHSVGHLLKSSYAGSGKEQASSGSMDLEQLQHMINCTVKKNPKAELSKTDLLRLLGYLEGELQARDVVIATLKADRLKQMVSHARYGRLLPINDPYAALQRDSRSATLLGVPSSDDAALLKAVTEGPMTALEAVVAQHRNSHVKLIQAMQDAEARHNKVLRELEDERRKHEHDTAQGDDITYGLEKERTRLREELEVEKQARKKLEKELKKVQETLDEERARQKQIVLLLLAERKKLICKYVEERNKAEDLVQILSEEKGRVDSMAEGLEEESRKALQMEAELEKQLATFDAERAQIRAQLLREEKRTKELEVVIDKLHAEVDHLKKQQAEAHQVAMFQAGLLNQQPNSPPRLSSVSSSISSSATLVSSSTVSRTSLLTSSVASSSSSATLPGKSAAGPPQTPPRAPVTVSSPRSSPSSASASPAPLTSATGLVVLGTAGKAVQPVAMVNSTPVQAPTTGIARAVSPAAVAPGGIRNVQYSMGGGVTATIGPLSNVPAPRTLPHSPAAGSAENADLAVTGRGGLSSAATPASPSPRVAVSASAGTKVFTTTNTDGKVTFHVTTSATLPPASSGPNPLAPTGGMTVNVTAQPTTPKKGASSLTARGVPPPVPPNKPVVPPKKSSASGGSVVGGISISTSATGQPCSPTGPPVIISCSPDSDQMTTVVDHGRPISLSLVPPPPPSPVRPSATPAVAATSQGVKFGITITKDKIQISGGGGVNPSAAAKVGGGPEGRAVDGLHDEDGSADDSTRPLSPWALSMQDLLDKELDDFQQLLSSMISPTSPNAPGPTTLTNSSATASPASADEPSPASGVMLHMGV